MAQKDKVKELVGRGLDSYHTKSLQQIDRINRKNKEQNHKISILTNELDNDYLTKTEEGSVVSLEHSKEGMVYIDSLEGNTMVNYCTDGSKELTLNGDIDTEGITVTTTEGVDNGEVDIMCEGDTLVNLMSKNWSHGTFETKNNRECLKVGKTLENAQYITNLKSGSTYTLIYDYISTELVNDTTNPFGRLHLTLTNRGAWVYDVPVKNFSSNKTEFTKLISVFTVPTNKQFTTLNVSGVLRDIDGTVWIDKEILLLEGDWSNKELPSYFEGMQSVGQDDANGHKIEILSQNKNLFNAKKFVALSAKDDFNSNSTYYECNEDNTINIKAKYDYRSPENMPFLRFEPNTTYTLSSNPSVDIEVKTGISKAYRDTQRVTFTTTDTGEVNFKFNAEVEDRLDSVSIQLEKGNAPTTYAPHTSNKKEILLNEPLRGLPNGVKDRFVKIGGKWFIERNVGQSDLIMTDGTDWGNGVAEGMIGFYEILSTANLNYNGTAFELEGNIVCDKLNSCTRSKLSTETKNSIIRGSDYVGVVVKRSDLETEDLEGVKKYINSLNAKFIYNLATPIYEPLETEPTLSTYNDITHISNNSLIPCNMKIENSGYNAIIKPSTLYTVALDTNKAGTIGMNLGGAKVTTTNNVATITTPATLADDSLRLYGKGIKASKVRLLEGDKTNWIPSHFEGMKSSFEDKFDEVDNCYKMEILSHNKNLIDFEGGITTNGKVSYDVDSKSCNISASNIENGIWNNVGIPIKVCNNKTYVLSYENITYKSANGVVVDKNSFVNIYEGKPNRKIGHINYGTKKGVFIIPHGVNVEDLRIRVHITQGTSDSATINIKGLMLTESKEGLEFTSPEHNKIQFSSIEPLRKWDRFIFKDGQLMIERGSRSVDLSSLIWGGYEDKNKCYKFGAQLNSAKRSSGNNANLICETLPVKADETKDSTISIYTHANSMELRICIRKHELSSFDRDGIAEWLSTNPTKIVYELAEPTYEEIPFELQKIILEGYENGTLFFDTNIPPTVTTTYAGETPIVSATKTNRVEVANNTTDINDNIIPYLCDMDYRIVVLELQQEQPIQVDFYKLFGGVYEMLKRDILSKRLSKSEYQYRLTDYFAVGKLTEQQVRELEDLINE